MDALRRILVAFGKQVRLQKLDVLNRRGLLVDDHKIDTFERREVHGAQVLRDEGAEAGLVDVRVRSQAGDEEIGLAARIHEMADMAGMNQVKSAVAHHHFPVTRARSNQIAKLLTRLYLAAEIAGW